MDPADILLVITPVLLTALLAVAAWLCIQVVGIKTKLVEIECKLDAGAKRFDDHERRLQALEGQRPGPLYERLESD